VLILREGGVGLPQKILGFSRWHPGCSSSLSGLQADPQPEEEDDGSEEESLQAFPLPESGAPPEVAAPRVSRGQKTAHVAVRKDTMILQAADGPRVIWGVTKPKVKKR